VFDIDARDYNEPEDNGTGSYSNNTDFKIITFPFDKYEITIKLTTDNEFIGVVEVKINKDFLSYKQKTTPKGYHDVEEFYRE
jgi:hypothetical protein